MSNDSDSTKLPTNERSRCERQRLAELLGRLLARHWLEMRALNSVNKNLRDEKCETGCNS